MANIYCAVQKAHLRGATIVVEEHEEKQYDKAIEATKDYAVTGKYVLRNIIQQMR